MNEVAPRLGGTTAATLRTAATACRALLASSQPSAREIALAAGRIATEAIVSDENWLEVLEDPVTRCSRYGYAGWLLLLAGTENDGVTGDLKYAAALFDEAAQALLG